MVKVERRKPTKEEVSSFVEVVSEGLEVGVPTVDIADEIPSLCDLRVPLRDLCEAAKKNGHPINIVEDVITRIVKVKRGKRVVEIPQTEKGFVFQYDFENGSIDMSKAKTKKAKKTVAKVQAKNEKASKTKTTKSHAGREGAAAVHFPKDLDVKSAKARDLISEVRKDLEHRIKSFSGGRISMGKANAELMVGYLKAAEAKSKK